MELTFGMACDGPSYPDFPGTAEGALNAAVVGPVGLLEALEIQLGLTGPRVSHAARVACYAAKLRAALSAQSTVFFARSFELDPWSTASTLLDWRDDLIAIAWPGTQVGAERIDALAAVENAGARLPPGISDRLRSVGRAVEDGDEVSIEAVTLVEPRRLVAPQWRRLLDLLETRGVVIVDASASGANAAGDLRRVQEFLASGSTNALAGDGTFTQVRADTALMAAEAVAEWLVHCPEADLQGTVVVSPDGDTALLDLALRARGLPALGQSAASRWRGALQVLPLAFSAAWAPFDAKALLDLLLLPHPPVSRHAARRLAYALSREPGTGGAAWAKAWQAIEEAEEARAAAEEGGREKSERRLAEWREWTTSGSHPRSKGMPAEAARAIAMRVARWAVETDAGREDPLLMATAGAANALVQAIDLIGLDLLPALLVERMIDQVLADGAKNPDHKAGAGGLRCVCSPGAIWGEARNVIWWDFKGPGQHVPPIPWTDREVGALEAAGCRLDVAAICAERISASNANAVSRARERILLVTPSLSGSDESISHPLAHHLEPLIASSRQQVMWTAEQLLEAAEHRLAGRTLARVATARVEPPRQRALWTTPQAMRLQLAGRIESATSFERLADCQLRWMLLDVVGLSRGRVAEIPGADQLFGNLAHEIANQVFSAGPVADPDALMAQVESAFDPALDAIATPLRQPEHAGELAAARSRVPAALAQLARLLREIGVEVVGTELDRERSFSDELGVKGRLDLVVRHPSSGLGVVDLKWTRSAKRRRTELADGRALQLATYGAIADEASEAPATGGYYLLAQRRLIAPEGSFLANESVETGRTLGQTWHDLVGTWKTWRDLASGGDLLATGAEGAAEHVPPDLAIEPGREPCRYCELTGLCRVATETI